MNASHMLLARTIASPFVHQLFYRPDFPAAKLGIQPRIQPYYQAPYVQRWNVQCCARCGIAQLVSPATTSLLIHACDACIEYLISQQTFNLTGLGSANYYNGQLLVMFKPEDLQQLNLALIALVEWRMANVFPF